MHETYDAYSIRSTRSCYWLDQFLTLALNILILSIFYISMDLSTNYFAHFSGCSAFFVCSCHSILECCVTFSGVKLSIRSFVLFIIQVVEHYQKGVYHIYVQLKIYHQALRYVKAWVSNAPGNQLEKYKYLS